MANHGTLNQNFPAPASVDDDPRLQLAIRNVFRLLHSYTQRGAPQVYEGFIRDNWLGEDSDLFDQVIGDLADRQLITRSAKPVVSRVPLFVPGMPNFELTEKGKRLGGKAL
ncbi:hypothetical protein C0Q98_00155 [Streptomyces albidoflavus]|nr:hypothetical protein C0Q98_00155 [Streptomyces albidoflavus]